MRSSAAILIAAAALAGCSPIYVGKVAVGHAKLLWHRKKIDKAIADPKTPPDLRAKLEIVAAARAFAFDEVGLRRSREYGTYSIVRRPFVTWIVEASDKLAFKQYLFHFPILGDVPYKGYFKEADAERQAKALADKGYDTYIGGVGAYNTPLPLSDPVPSTVLGYQPGELSELIIHELTHSTVYFKNNSDFNESLATFVGIEGARQFLARRFGAGSSELKAYLKTQEDDALFDLEIDRAYEELDVVYKSTATGAEKLSRRQALLAENLKRIQGAGFTLKKLNNAVILAHRVYHRDISWFARAYEAQGRDWAQAIAFFKSLDPKDPYADLKRRLGG